MNSPESVAASERMRDLIYQYHVAPKPEGVDAWLAFRPGQGGDGAGGDLHAGVAGGAEGAATYAGAPVPQFGPKKGVWGGSHLMAQPRGLAPERSRAAWRLMRYLSDHSLLWAKGRPDAGAALGAASSPEFQALPVQAQFARQLPYVHYEPLTPRANALMPFVDPAIEAVLLDLQTPEEAMRDAGRRDRPGLRRP